jgi:competence ComEA-like helix-hairpin-helix protein
MERERIAWLSLALLSALLFVLVRPHHAPALPADLTSENRLALGLAIDVNAASTAELESIPGIGPTRAAAIVADRDRDGPFADVDALERVKGIGPATLDAIRPYVMAGEERGATPAALHHGQPSRE